MIFLTFIILIVAYIVFFKTKKIKELNKSLLKKEEIFISLYEQRFEYFLKLINRTEIKIQDSVYIDIGELRKESIFIKKDASNSQYLELENRIQLIIKKVNQNNSLKEFENQSELVDLNNNTNILNNLIEKNKLEYNNLTDDFNQETNDFFGKIISRYIKELKKFKHI